MTRIPLAPAESRCRAASSHISPAPISITTLSVRSPRIFFASSTAAYDTETALFATRVSVRTRFATENDFVKNLSSTGPIALNSQAYP